jgi:hypothetical protein
MRQIGQHAERNICNLGVVEMHFGNFTELTEEVRSGQQFAIEAYRS